MLGRGKSQPRPVTRGFFYIPRVTGDAGIFAEDRGRSYIFKEFLKALSEWIDREFPSLVYKYPDRATNEYVKNYDMVAVLVDHEGNKVCYSVNYLNKLPQVFVDRIRSHLQIMPDDTILWADDVYSTPRPASAREVIYGQKPEKPPKNPTRRELAKKWQHPEALTPEEMSFLMGKPTEPPKP